MLSWEQQKCSSKFMLLMQETWGKNEQNYWCDKGAVVIAEWNIARIVVLKQAHEVTNTAIPFPKKPTYIL